MVHNNPLPTESQAAWTFDFKVARRPIMLEVFSLAESFIGVTKANIQFLLLYLLNSHRFPWSDQCCCHNQHFQFP